VTCNVLYRDWGARVIWRIDAHPMVKRKELIERLKKFSPTARFMDACFGELTEEQSGKVINAGRFPDVERPA